MTPRPHLRDEKPTIRGELDRGIMPRWLTRLHRDRDHAAILIDATATRDHPPPPTTADTQLRTLTEDPTVRLRGIPCIARGVPGASPHTRPDHAIRHDLLRSQSDQTPANSDRTDGRTYRR